MKDDSIEELYVRYVPDAVRFACFVVGDMATAEDVVHDAFVRAATRWRILSERRDFGAYLRKAVVRAAQSRYRSQVREQHRVLEYSRQSSSPYSRSAGDPAERPYGNLVDRLSVLTAEQRIVLVMRYWMDYSDVQISDATGWPLGTVKSHARRGLEKLRAADHG